jgi:hypothetical protein
MANRGRKGYIKTGNLSITPDPIRTLKPGAKIFDLGPIDEDRSIHNPNHPFLANFQGLGVKPPPPLKGLYLPNKKSPFFAEQFAYPAYWPEIGVQTGTAQVDDAEALVPPNPKDKERATNLQDLRPPLDKDEQDIPPDYGRPPPLIGEDFELLLPSGPQIPDQPLLLNRQSGQVGLAKPPPRPPRPPPPVPKDKRNQRSVKDRNPKPPPPRNPFPPQDPDPTLNLRPQPKPTPQPTPIPRQKPFNDVLPPDNPTSNEHALQVVPVKEKVKDKSKDKVEQDDIDDEIEKEREEDSDDEKEVISEEEEEETREWIPILLQEPPTFTTPVRERVLNLERDDRPAREQEYETEKEREGKVSELEKLRQEWKKRAPKKNVSTQKPIKNKPTRETYAPRKRTVLRVPENQQEPVRPEIIPTPPIIRTQVLREEEPGLRTLRYFSDNALKIPEPAEIPRPIQRKRKETKPLRETIGNITPEERKRLSTKGKEIFQRKKELEKEEVKVKPKPEKEKEKVKSTLGVKKQTLKKPARKIKDTKRQSATKDILLSVKRKRELQKEMEGKEKGGFEPPPGEAAVRKKRNSNESQESDTKRTTEFVRGELKKKRKAEPEPQQEEKEEEEETNRPKRPPPGTEKESARRLRRLKKLLDEREERRQLIKQDTKERRKNHKEAQEERQRQLRERDAAEAERQLGLEEEEDQARADEGEKEKEREEEKQAKEDKLFNELTYQIAQREAKDKKKENTRIVQQAQGKVGALRNQVPALRNVDNHTVRELDKLYETVYDSTIPGKQKLLNTLVSSNNPKGFLQRVSEKGSGFEGDVRDRASKLLKKFGEKNEPEKPGANRSNRNFRKQKEAEAQRLGIRGTKRRREEIATKSLKQKKQAKKQPAAKRARLREGEYERESNRARQLELA